MWCGGLVISAQARVIAEEQIYIFRRSIFGVSKDSFGYGVCPEVCPEVCPSTGSSENILGNPVIIFQYRFRGSVRIHELQGIQYFAF